LRSHAIVPTQLLPYHATLLQDPAAPFTNTTLNAHLPMKRSPGLFDLNNAKFIMEYDAEIETSRFLPSPWMTTPCCGARMPMNWITQGVKTPEEFPLWLGGQMVRFDSSGCPTGYSRSETFCLGKFKHYLYFILCVHDRTRTRSSQLQCCLFHFRICSYKPILSAIHRLDDRLTAEDFSLEVVSSRNFAITPDSDSPRTMMVSHLRVLYNNASTVWQNRLHGNTFPIPSLPLTFNFIEPNTVNRSRLSRWWHRTTYGQVFVLYDAASVHTPEVNGSSQPADKGGNWWEMEVGRSMRIWTSQRTGEVVVAFKAPAKEVARVQLEVGVPQIGALIPWQTIWLDGRGGSLPTNSTNGTAALSVNSTSTISSGNVSLASALAHTVEKAANETGRAGSHVVDLLTGQIDFNSDPEGAFWTSVLRYHATLKATQTLTMEKLKRVQQLRFTNVPPATVFSINSSVPLSNGPADVYIGSLLFSGVPKMTSNAHIAPSLTLFQLPTGTSEQPPSMPRIYDEDPSIKINDTRLIVLRQQLDPSLRKAFGYINTTHELLGGESLDMYLTRLGDSILNDMANGASVQQASVSLRIALPMLRNLSNQFFLLCEPMLTSLPLYLEIMLDWQESAHSMGVVLPEVRYYFVFFILFF
jgi:hypothetical protein